MDVNRHTETIGEDECVFFIYPDESLLKGEENKLDAVVDKLNAIKREVETLCEGYIWHNELFEIQPQNLIGEDPVFFRGGLNYGINVEDEWFLVHVLLQLTERFHDIVVKVSDSDGDFLLIEAAEELPSWVSPETCEGRVFLHKGHIHILPQSFRPLEDDEPFHVSQDVLDFVRMQPEKSRVSPKVETTIRKRIGTYPDKLANVSHDAVVYVPVAVAALLEKHPKLITAAVRAFCDRDLIDVRACRAMKFFPPEQRVLSKVKFTKCSYAMLASSKYQPDKRTGWNLPAPTDEAYKAHLLGVKLACGFEILVAQGKSSKAGNNEDSGKDMSNEPGWLKMKAKLEEMNYFRGLLEHSKQYNELLNQAKNFYRQCKEDAPPKVTSHRIAELMDSLEFDIDDLKKREIGLRVTDGDDSWMNVTKDDLDEMLAARFGAAPDMVDLPDSSEPNIAKHLTSFINHVSGVDGVEFPTSDESPVRPARGVKSKNAKCVKFSADTKMHSVTSNEQIAASTNQRVTIDPDGFMNAVQNILDFSIPDDNYWDSDGSGMSSYEDEDEIDLAGLASGADKKMSNYMKEMDRELASTTMGQSFIKKPNQPGKNGESFEHIEEFEPVDIDMNALKNIILSYKTQMGNSGPAENILGAMGVNLQDIDADAD